MSSSKDRKRNANTLAKELLSTQFIWNPKQGSPEMRAKTLRYWQGQFYRYREGKYERLPATEVDVIVTKFLQGRDIEVTERVLRSIRKNLAALVHLPMDMQLDSWVNRQEMGPAISASNGIVLLNDRDELGRPYLISHSPVYFSLSKLPYAYKPHAGCPNWREFVADIMEGDNERIVLLQQFAGYVLTSHLKYHKFLLCVGEGANGKTVFFTLMELLVGRENCSHVPLSAFDRHFALACTEGKRLVSINESGRQVSEAAEMVLKSYTSGDSLTIDRKHREPVNMVPTAKIMISTNVLPRFMDKTFGLWRRALIVPFGKTIPEERQNRNLVEELQEELPGILNWAIEGMDTLERDGGFINPEACK